MEANSLILGQKGIGRWKSWCMQAFLCRHLLNESLSRSGSQDVKSSNILAEGGDFNFLPSASPHHSLLSVDSKGEIQAWLERTWDTGTAWPFLLIAVYATSHNCEPLSTHKGCHQVILGQLSAIHLVNGHPHPMVLSDGTACNHTELCVLTELLFTRCYYTPVIAAPVLPQKCPHACLSLPLLIKARGCLKCAISSFTKKSLPSPGNVCLLCWPCSGGFPIPQQSVTGFRTRVACVTIQPSIQSYQEYLQPCSRPKPCQGSC